MLWLGMVPYVSEQAYGGQGVECGGLNMLGLGSGTIRRCSLAGGRQCIASCGPNNQLSIEWTGFTKSNKWIINQGFGKIFKIV